MTTKRDPDDVVVQLPPRAAAPAPPRKFWVMPTDQRRRGPQGSRCN